MVRAGLLAIAVSLELLAGAFLFNRYEPWFLGPLFDIFHPPTLIGRIYVGAMTIAFLAGGCFLILGALARWARVARKSHRH
jgi:hypothetical protein